MRIVIASLLCHFFFSFNVCHGQSRKIDLKVELSDSLANDTVYSPGSLPVKAYLINNGPDSIFRFDRFMIDFVFGNSVYSRVFPSATKDMGVGDTFFYNANLPLVYKVNVFNITYCAYAEIYSLTKDSFIAETKNELKNNTGCQPISHISNYTSIKKIDSDASVIVYPNPATKELTIKSNHHYAIEIYDQMGKYLINIPLSANFSTEKQIDISQLQKGIYFLKIIYSGNSEVVKFEKY